MAARNANKDEFVETGRNQGTEIAIRTPRRCCFTAVALLLVLLSACGGSAPRQAERPEETRVERSDGRSVFLSHCYGCHALAKLGSSRPVGGDLTNWIGVNIELHDP